MIIERAERPRLHPTINIKGNMLKKKNLIEKRDKLIRYWPLFSLSTIISTIKPKTIPAK